MQALSDSTRARLRQILLEDWDPHDAFKRPEAHSTYDAWVAPLWDLIASGASEEQAMEWLHEREKETMCFPSLGRERLRRAARKLVRLRAASDPA
ncbi:MAG TPA: hypothetical protein VH475_18640 [Tepidisphaeraceae bacterium]